jgi:predicted Zn-ribbon and HTH transcriptional regulator
VPGCEKPGTYLDRKYVRLCNNHERYTALRRKRGDKDPYQGIENKYMPKYKTRRPYSRNNGFWQFIKTNISPEEWGHIWRWAKGIEKKLDMKTLEKIRSIWQDAVAELPEPLKKYKKVESLVFMDLTCETCGHEFEFDAMTKLEKNVDIPESCPDCGGRNISKRTQRVAYIISQYKKGALSKQDAALILGRHPDDIKKYGTIFQKKGIKELGLKLKDPYFKRFRTQVIPHKPKKGGNIKKFSYFTH